VTLVRTLVGCADPDPPVGGSGSGPVLHAQPGHALEVPHVAGHERQVAGQRDRRDPEIGLGEAAAFALEPGAERPYNSALHRNEKRPSTQNSY
jgi:hypothetical protein